MTQSLISDHFPYLPIHLEVRQTVYDFEALLDTGFDGGVIIPSELASNIGDPDWTTTITLADGSQIEAPTYIGILKLGDTEIRPVLANVLGNEPFIGVAIIRHFTVILDHGLRVILEQ